MRYAELVKAQRRHMDLGDVDADPRPLVHYATLAASSHNTQPWRFRCQPGRITVAADLSRRCPAVDPDDHHLYASLGCAVENLLLAAEAAGRRGTVTFDGSAAAVHIDFAAAPARRSALFEAIPTRQCTRTEYEERALTRSERAALEAVGNGSGVSMRLITTDLEREQVAQYVMQGNIAQFADAAWKRELRQWIRFDVAEAEASGDGLFGPVMGSPQAPRWLGELFARFMMNARSQNQRDLHNIRRSGAVAVFLSEQDDAPHWFEAGRCYQRVALQADALGLRSAFINQPVEVAALRGEFARYLGVSGGRVDLVIRLGHGPRMPYSLRRPLESVMELG
jgi:hypothetical protein